MHLFELTRALVDIDSVTPNEFEIGNYLYCHLRPLADKYDGRIELMPVAPQRNNVYVNWDAPDVVLSTHMDTVPPFIPSREDDECIWGRGACDTHGIGASMIKATEALLEEGVRNLGLLFVVGEEIDGVGATKANENSPGSRYLINGEPTENLLGLGTKGALRVELEATGKSVHSAYVELGDSAIDKLLDNLQALRQVEWPVDELFGDTTLNIGTISGGQAANVIPDHAAASVAIRVVSDLGELKQLVFSTLDDRVTATVSSEVPAVHLKSVPGFETTIVKYATDIPKLTNWGQPLLIGPGTIHVAHSVDEHVPKKQLIEAVELYKSLVKQLQATQ